VSMDTSQSASHDTINLLPDKDPALCQIPGCTNRRSNAGYGRLRKVCERHHHQRYQMPYNSGSARVRSVRKLVREDFETLARVARERGYSDILAHLNEMRKKYA
jgi:hypothetical protein